MKKKYIIILYVYICVYIRQELFQAIFRSSARQRYSTLNLVSKTQSSKQLPSKFTRNLLKILFFIFLLFSRVFFTCINSALFITKSTRYYTKLIARTSRLLSVLSILQFDEEPTPGFQHSYSTLGKTFQKAIISYPLIHTRICAYQSVRNVSFSKSYAYLLNE